MTGTLAFDKFQLIGNEIIEFTKSEDPDKVYQWSDSKGKKYGVNNLPPILVTEHGYAHPKWVGKTRDDFEGKVVNDITCRANKYMRKVLAELKEKKEKEADELKKLAQKLKREEKKAKKAASATAAVAVAAAAPLSGVVAAVAAIPATAIPPTPLPTAVAATPATTTTKAVAVIAGTPFATTTVDAASAPAPINNHDIIQAILPLFHNHQQLIANTIHNQENQEWKSDRILDMIGLMDSRVGEHRTEARVANEKTNEKVAKTNESLAMHVVDTSRKMNRLEEKQKQLEDDLDSIKKPPPCQSSTNLEMGARNLFGNISATRDEGSFDAAPEDAYGSPDTAADDAVTVDTPRARGGGGGSTTVDKEVTEEKIGNDDQLEKLVSHYACSFPDAAVRGGVGGGSTTVNKEGTEEKTGNDDPLEKLVSHNACSSPDAAVRGGGGGGGGFTTVDKDVAEEETCNDDDPPTGDPPVAAADDAVTVDTPRARGGGGGSTTVDKEVTEENRNFDPLGELVPHNACSSPDAAALAGGGDGGSTAIDKEDTEENRKSDPLKELVSHNACNSPVAGVLSGGGDGFTTVDKECTEEKTGNDDAVTGVPPTDGLSVAGGGGGGFTTVDKECTEEKTGNDDAVTGVPPTDGLSVAAGGGGGGFTTVDKDGTEEKTGNSDPLKERVPSAFAPPAMSQPQQQHQFQPQQAMAPQQHVQQQFQPQQAMAPPQQVQQQFQPQQVVAPQQAMAPQQQLIPTPQQAMAPQQQLIPTPQQACLPQQHQHYNPSNAPHQTCATATAAIATTTTPVVVVVVVAATSAAATKAVAVIAATPTNVTAVDAASAISVKPSIPSTGGISPSESLYVVSKEASGTGTNVGSSKTFASLPDDVSGGGNASTPNLNNEVLGTSTTKSTTENSHDEDNTIRVNGSTYEKIKVIGRGGSCEVYQALSSYNSNSNEERSVVAIKKVTLVGVDAKTIESYKNEITILESLQGKCEYGIIKMIDSQVDFERKSIYVVMELGEDLKCALQQQPRTLNYIRLLWEQMLIAVDCIHKENIIHRDLKPANFLLVGGCLKLIDFGISEVIVNYNDTTNLYLDNRCGTLHYMSPEAINDNNFEEGEDLQIKVGYASDIWSLGCILYEMVYRKTPFAEVKGNVPISTINAITDGDHAIPFPEHIDFIKENDTKEAVINTMKQCLHRNPKKRPQIKGLLDAPWLK